MQGLPGIRPHSFTAQPAHMLLPVFSRLLATWLLSCFNCPNIVQHPLLFNRFPENEDTALLPAQGMNPIRKASWKRLTGPKSRFRRSIWPHPGTVKPTESPIRKRAGVSQNGLKQPPATIRITSAARAACGLLFSEVQPPQAEPLAAISSIFSGS